MILFCLYTHGDFKRNIGSGAIYLLLFSVRLFLNVAVTKLHSIIDVEPGDENFQRKHGIHHHFFPGVSLNYVVIFF